MYSPSRSVSPVVSIFPGLKRRLRSRLLSVAAASAMVFGLAACEQGGAQQSGGREDAPPPEVATWIVRSERVAITTELPGRTAPFLVAEIRPQVSGIIQERLFTEGSEVKEGDLLYRIDPAPFEAEVAVAEANVAAAMRRADQARAALQAAEARVAEQEAVNELAQRDRERFEALVADGAVSVAERDQAVAQARVAEASLTSARAQVNTSRQAIAEAEAAIEQARAALDRACINLEYTRITAPISGRIGRSNVTVGALVTAGQPVALATIQQIDPIYVDVPQSTVELLRLRRSLEEGRLKLTNGDQNVVTLLLEDGSTYPTTGTLQFRDISVDPGTGSVILRMVFPNPNSLLLPQMYVRAIVEEGVNEQGVLVPQQAVTRDQRGVPMVMVVTPEGVVEQRELDLDRAIGNQWLVNGGVEPGEQVIVEGLQKVRDGSKVSPVVLHSLDETETPSAEATPAPTAAQ